jgi:HAD superfamily hydrolase (TIGR01509 family)
MACEPCIRGLIFDLDGTLVQSRLDFEAIRRELGLPPGEPLLEVLARLPAAEARHALAVLERHEERAAHEAVPTPGIAQLLDQVAGRGLRAGVLTRSARRFALASLARTGLRCDPVLGREDAPPKPDPAGIWQICHYWGLPPDQAAMIGDYRFDIEAGRRAGVRTVLYTAGRTPTAEELSWGADLVIGCFLQPDPLLQWLA